MRTSEQLNELGAALCEFRKNLRPIPKTKTADFMTKSGRKVSYNYADLADVWEAIRVPLSESGLSVVQTLDNEATYRVIHTMLLHKSGQWVKSSSAFSMAYTEMRDVGSQITYLRRYALSSILGLVTDDDVDVHPDEADTTTPHMKKNKTTADDKISVKWATEIAERLAHHDDLRVELLSLCGVKCVADIKESQKDTVTNFIKAKGLQK